METIYLIIVVILFLLAASDLIVGVSNDAVNFLNAAIGSKVASFRVIMAVAAVGILVGATFSSGMMEVARKGIFNPGEFSFSDIMLVFLAVMVADVIILDTFNTFGLPTSTTVSIVFELLGAAVGMGLIKMFSTEGIDNISQFINSSKALAIISGILVSVAVAFTIGALLQYLIRIIFSFNYERNLKYFGALFGGFSFTLLTYFMLIKGVNGASFMSDEMKTSITTNSGLILIFSFIGWTIILQVLNWLFKLNILKTIVLVGTFSLAMAFAGNDLVNFIGVPLAGFSSFEIFQGAHSTSPELFSMHELAGKIKTPTYFLLIAGLIMVVTLFTSRKAKSVVKTSVDLSRQQEGDERFRAYGISKLVVRTSAALGGFIGKIVPGNLRKYIDKQFEPATISTKKVKKEEQPAFDLIRAAVTLVVSSALIALGTSLTLPLSTTYVTFMVAMGTSFADRAWDRESAVYRVTGVFAVIGGWFLTALSAFTVAFLLAFVFYYGAIYGIFGMLIVTGVLVYRSHAFHKKSAAEKKEETEDVQTFSDDNIVEKSILIITNNLGKICNEYERSIDGLEHESIKELRKAEKNILKATARTKYLKNHINVIVDKIRNEFLDSGYYYVQVLDYMREMLHSISFFISPALEHIENNHKPLLPAQIEELRDTHNQICSLLILLKTQIENSEFDQEQKVYEIQEKVLHQLGAFQKNQLKRVKNHEVGTRNSLLYLALLQESKSMILQGVNLYKSQRDFFNYKNGNAE